jgi:hypothetical protein
MELFVSLYQDKGHSILLTVIDKMLGFKGTKRQ